MRRGFLVVRLLALAVLCGLFAPQVFAQAEAKFLQPQWAGHRAAVFSGSCANPA